MARLNGTPGDDSIVGTAGEDSIDISQGGEDTVLAGAGTDTVFAGAALDAGDHIDGGGRTDDVLVLDGDYSAGLVFTDTTVTGFGQLRLVKHHDYDLTFADGTDLSNGGSGNVDVLDLRAGDHVRIDASAFAGAHQLQLISVAAAETVIGGAADDTLDVRGQGAVDFSGGAGQEVVTFERAMTKADRVDGGDGHDLLNFEGGGVMVFTARMLQHFEQIQPLDGSYDMTLSRGSLAAGQFLQVSANNLAAGQNLSFDGSAVRAGVLDLLGGQGDDVLVGGAGGDALDGSGGTNVITGGGGADQMQGGDFEGGANTFVYTALSDSGHHKAYDRIDSLGINDRIDLSAIDADTTQAGNQAFHQVTGFSGHAGELVLSYDTTTFLTTLAVDVDGDGHADMAVHLAGDHSGFTGLVL